MEDEEPGRLRRELEGHAARHVVGQVADEVDRAAEHRLRAVAAVRGVDAAVVEDADVVHAAVGLDEVVAHHVDVVAVDVDRRGAALGVALRRPVGRDADAVVEVGDGVAGDDVAGPVDLDRVVAGEQVRAVRPGAGPQRPGPADQPEAIVAAEEQVVGDVEVARARVLGPDAEADLLEPAVLDRQRHGTGHVLAAGAACRRRCCGSSDRRRCDGACPSRRRARGCRRRRRPPRHRRRP